MLKNRGKIFVPKAKGIVRRQPSAAPSSARPSVERQSQTPAPRQENVVSLVEEEAVAEATESREPVAETQSQEDSSQTRTPLPDTTAHRHPILDTHKRKTRDDDIPEPPAKRFPANIGRAESSTQETDHETHLYLTSHDTPSTQRGSLKRKEREEDNAEPPAKRVSTEGESLAQAATTESEISLQTQNEEATPRAASTHEPVESSETVQPTRQSTEPEAENSSAENNDDEESQSSREPTFQAPQYQYPDPENMNIARIVDDIPGARLGSMGPAGGNGSGLGAAGDLGAAGRNTQAAQFSEIVPRGVLNPDGTSGGIIEEVASGTEKTKKGKRKYIKRKKVQAPEIGDDGRATVEMQLVKPRREKGQRRVRRKADGNRERKQRAATPEGAEEEEIDRENMTMTDLCKDLRIGRPFSMHAEIKARIQKKKADLARIKLRKEHPELIPLMDAEDDAPAGDVGQAGPSGANSAPAAEPEVQEVSAPAAAGPQMRIIDGQIVIDDRTLQIDRQKRAQALQAEMTEVEENDFTRVITSGTWMKMERSQVWDASANALFYDCLSRHGTDFEMIASYFPHRNRRQIKLKFNKEERNNPAKITKAMTNPRKKPIDLEEYQKMSNIQLEEVAAIDKERADYDAEQMAEQNKQEAAKAEVTRKKKEAIQSTSAAARRVLASVELSDEEEDGPGRATGGESAKENREPAGRSKSVEAPAPKGGKKKSALKKPRKNKHSHYAGGDEVEVLGTID